MIQAIWRIQDSGFGVPDEKLAQKIRSTPDFVPGFCGFKGLSLGFLSMEFWDHAFVWLMQFFHLVQRVDLTI